MLAPLAAEVARSAAMPKKRVLKRVF